jgi:hypothetical protein
MVEINIPINEDTLFFIAFFVILAIHLYPLVRYSLPLGWDNGFYFYALTKRIEPMSTAQEPLYFYLAYALSNVFGVIPTIKLIQFSSIIILSLGTYLFTREYFDKRTAIIIMLIVAMIPATSRIWQDQERNILALSFFPLLLYVSLKNETQYTLASGLILGLIGLTHRFVYLFAIAGLGLFTLTKLKKLWVRNGVVLAISLIMVSPFLFYRFFVILPTTQLEAVTLFKWEQVPFQFSYIIQTSSMAVFFGICSFLLVLLHNKRDEPTILLMCYFVFAFILFTGLVGTPFLVYERYMLIFSIMSAIFSAPYISEFIKSSFKPVYVNLILTFFVIILIIFGFSYIKELTPFIIPQEIEAFKWINYNLPANTTLLIPSREHYWADAITGKNIVPLEWYQLLMQQPPTDEVKIITGSIVESEEALKKVKVKYNQTDIYLFFTLPNDPILPSDNTAYQLFLQKTAKWNQTMTWGNGTVSFLFKL